MGNAFATMADNAPADPVAEAAAAVAPDAPTLAPEPFVSPQGQAAAPLPDVSGLVQQQPRIPVPVMPPMPGSPLQTDPRAKLALIAAIGAALAGGGSAGAGMLHGTLGAIQAKHEEDLRRWQFQANETKQQQLAAQNQQAIQDRQNEARLQQTFASLRDAVNKAPDEEAYKRIIGGFSAQLQMAGYRIQPQALMAQFQFIPQTDEQLIAKQLHAYDTDPKIVELRKVNPAAADAGAIQYKRNGVTIQLPVDAARARLGSIMPTQTPGGDPLYTTPDKGTETQQAMVMATSEFRAQGVIRDPKNPKPYDDALMKRVHEITDKKDPVMESMAQTLRQLQIQNAQQNLGDKRGKASGEASTIDDNASELVSGNLLPSMLSKRASTYNATLKAANRLSIEQTGKPMNFVKQQLDYEAAKKWAASQNSTQMVRFQGLANSVVNTIDEVKRLADELRQGDIQKWNSVKRGTVQQVYGNTPQSELAAQYIGAVNTLKEEFANLAQGGMAPTDSAWKLANQQINQDYGFKDMNASLTEVQRLINFRMQGFRDVRPTLMPDGNAPAPQTNRRYYDSNGNPK